MRLTQQHLSSIESGDCTQGFCGPSQGDIAKTLITYNTFKWLLCGSPSGTLYFSQPPWGRSWHSHFPDEETKALCSKLYLLASLRPCHCLEISRWLPCSSLWRRWSDVFVICTLILKFLPLNNLNRCTKICVRFKDTLKFLQRRGNWSLEYVYKLLNMWFIL